MFEGVSSSVRSAHQLVPQSAKLWRSRQSTFTIIRIFRSQFGGHSALAPIAFTTVARTHLYFDFQIGLRVTRSGAISREATASSCHIAAIGVAISFTVADSHARAVAATYRKD